MKHSRAARQTGLVALTAALVTILAGCGGGGGNGGGSTPPPSGNPNPPQTSSRLTVTGTVTDAPIANAVVTATVGGQTFTANADANGKYSLEITLPQNATSGFVTLNAKGVGAQSYVEFASLLGTFSSLLTQAGSDAILSSTENFGTQITNVSTAIAFLLRDANGGQAVTSETSIQTLSAGLNGQDVLDLATAIKLLVDAAEDYPMPPGQTSLSALLSNTAAREQLVDAAYLLDRATFVATQNAIVSDATVIKPTAPASVPSSLVASTLPGDLAYTYSGLDRAVAYTFDAGGTGVETTSRWHRNFTWSLAAGAIEITYVEADPAHPLEISNYERRVCLQDPYFGYGPEDIFVAYTVDRATLRRLNDRILTITENRHITYRDCGTTGATETVTIARTVIDANDTLPISSAELRDTTRTLWVYDEVSDIGNDTGTMKVLPDIATLYANGTGSTRFFNKQFAWSVDSSGKILTADFTDGTVAKYRVLRDFGDVESDVLYDLALPTGERNVGAGMSILADPRRPFAFTPNNVVGRHYYLGVGEEGAPAEQKGFRFRLDADGTGSRENEILDAAGNVVVVDAVRRNSWGLFWRIEGRDLLMHRTRTGLGGGYSCSPGVEPECLIYEDRRLIPIMSDGARTYSLEIYRYDANGVSPLSMRQTSVAMYDYEPFGASASSIKPVLASKSGARQARPADAMRLKELRVSPLTERLGAHH